MEPLGNWPKLTSPIVFFQVDLETFFLHSLLKLTSSLLTEVRTKTLSVFSCWSTVEKREDVWNTNAADVPRAWNCWNSNASKVRKFQLKSTNGPLITEPKKKKGRASYFFSYRLSPQNLNQSAVKIESQKNYERVSSLVPKSKLICEQNRILEELRTFFIISGENEHKTRSLPLSFPCQRRKLIPPSRRLIGLN